MLLLSNESSNLYDNFYYRTTFKNFIMKEQKKKDVAYRCGSATKRRTAENKR